MVVHTYTAAFRRLRQEFRASLDYIANSWAGRDGGENMREKNLKKKPERAETNTFTPSNKS